MCKADDERAEDVLKGIVFQGATDCLERLGGLLTHDRLVRLCERLQEGQEDSFVIVELPDLAQLLGDGKENLVILILDQSYSTRRRLG